MKSVAKIKINVRWLKNIKWVFFMLIIPFMTYFLWKNSYDDKDGLCHFIDMNFA